MRCTKNAATTKGSPVAGHERLGTDDPMGLAAATSVAVFGKMLLL
jgi:hypothetical protein